MLFSSIYHQSRDQFWEKVRKTLDSYLRNVICASRGVWWDIGNQQMSRPVFVVGCSRAGTTLVYKTLSESTQIGTLQRETHDFWSSLHPLDERHWAGHALTVEQASAADRSKVARYFYRATGIRRFVDKNNQNGLCVGYLHTLFPDACFVYVKRSPGDNINSLIEGWRKPGQFATWSGDLPEKVNIDNGDVTQWCFFLPEGWRNYINKTLEEVCAFQYREMNTAILGARADIPAGQWVEIFYEDILREPVAVFRQVFEKCGLEFTDDIRAHCQQVLNKPYNAFSEIRIDKWRDGPNRARIERALPDVTDVVTRMGYRDGRTT